MHKNSLSLAFCAAAATSLAPAQAQSTPNELQSAGFNSTFTLSASQIASANLTASLAADIEAAVRFDRSQLANGGTDADDFYTLPASSSIISEAGVLLKVQEVTDATSFTLPSNTALSRILYTTTNLNGTVIPASAFVLWPFQPRVFSSEGNSSAEEKGGKKAPTVLWSHGTSGFFAPQAPSTHRGLWYEHSAPFTLALDGYAVVAPDYGGLGVGTSWDGSAIPHQYLASRVSARDGLYALRAARTAFPDLLSDDFVAFGHSQGGGVAWGVAEVLAENENEGENESENPFADLKSGFRGAVAGSPTTDLFTGFPQFILPFVSLALGGVFPSFDVGEWLTPLGIARRALFAEIRGGIAAAQKLFLDADSGPVIREAWDQTWYVPAYGRLGNVGSRALAGPLLVIQGTADVYVPYDVTTTTVMDTCAFLEKVEGGENTDLEYLVVNGTGHVPTLDATRPVWLGWIADRFEGRPVAKTGCVRTDMTSWLEFDRYMATTNSYRQWAGAAEYAFETPLGI
ncbi:hypothetical protein F4859DRAFT_50206 [Xylaria cf. heliscus]|nr:hypothetical protein F4859DRAFT_50206 [Xylaria cf. heliscus]